MGEKYYVVWFPEEMSIRYTDGDGTTVAINLPHKEGSQLRAERVAELLNRLAEEHAKELRMARLEEDE